MGVRQDAWTSAYGRDGVGGGMRNSGVEKQEQAGKRLVEWGDTPLWQENQTREGSIPTLFQSAASPPHIHTHGLKTEILSLPPLGIHDMLVGCCAVSALVSRNRLSVIKLDNTFLAWRGDYAKCNLIVRRLEDGRWCEKDISLVLGSFKFWLLKSKWKWWEWSIGWYW